MADAGARPIQQPARAHMTMKSAPLHLRRMSKVALAAVAIVLAVHGQGRADYPEKPVRLLLPSLPAARWTLLPGS